MLLTGDNEDRGVRKIEGCLLKLPKEQLGHDIIHCGLCTNHSIMLGSLIPACKTKE